MLIAGALLYPAVGQTAQSQQPATGQIQSRPPIEHYYLQFLRHQNQLDEWAARQAAKGHDGSVLHNHLQKDMGFSDAEYAPIRVSSVRLTAKVKALGAQAAALKASGAPLTSYAPQMKALAAQRDADLNAEVAFLKGNLSPDKRAKLEAFMVQFFSPAHATDQRNSATQQPAPAAVKP